MAAIAIDTFPWLETPAGERLETAPEATAGIAETAPEAAPVRRRQAGKRQGGRRRSRAARLLVPLRGRPGAGHRADHVEVLGTERSGPALFRRAWRPPAVPRGRPGRVGGTTGGSDGQRSGKNREQLIAASRRA